MYVIKLISVQSNAKTELDIVHLTLFVLFLQDLAIILLPGSELIRGSRISRFRDTAFPVSLLLLYIFHPFDRVITPAWYDAQCDAPRRIPVIFSSLRGVQNVCFGTRPPDIMCRNILRASAILRRRELACLWIHFPLGTLTIFRDIWTTTSCLYSASHLKYGGCLFSSTPKELQKRDMAQYVLFVECKTACRFVIWSMHLRNQWSPLFREKRSFPLCASWPSFNSAKQRWMRIIVSEVRNRNSPGTAVRWECTGDNLAKKRECDHILREKWKCLPGRKKAWERKISLTAYPLFTPVSLFLKWWKPLSLR